MGVFAIKNARGGDDAIATYELYVGMFASCAVVRVVVNCARVPWLSVLWFCLRVMSSGL